MMLQSGSCLYFSTSKSKLNHIVMFGDQSNKGYDGRGNSQQGARPTIWSSGNIVKSIVHQRLVTRVFFELQP
jgi:hypothetical protein